MSKGKRILIGAGIALVIAAALFLVGFFIGRGQMAAQQAQAQQLRAQAQQLRAQFATAEALSRLLVARGWVYRATIDLEQRNFGLANSDLSRATAILRSVQPAQAGVDPTQMQRLAQAIAGTNVQVATDIGNQRRQILALADGLDTLLPQQVAQADVR
ncbi:MAG TPA: hypothetical protein VFB38_06215 [Chthonomonadaceae bacterium]|nr:hypothetical protein [Chthonomonadaceae bacterium]